MFGLKLVKSQNYLDLELQVAQLQDEVSKKNLVIESLQSEVESLQEKVKTLEKPKKSNKKVELLTDTASAPLKVEKTTKKTPRKKIVRKAEETK